MQIATTHKNSDFDAVASTIAATLLYPGAVPVLTRALNPNVKAFFSIHKNVFDIKKTTDIDFDSVTKLIITDTNTWSRIGKLQELKSKKDLEIILWDHHMNKGTVEATWKCQEAIGATITLMVRELKKQRKLLTPIQATLFLAGIYEDTGNLMFPSTTPEDAYAAAYLLERKADLKIIKNFLRPAYGEKQKDILFQMLQKSQRMNLNGHKVGISTVKIKGHVSGLAVVVQMYKEISNVDAAFGIFPNEGNKNCMIIGRSSTENLDMGMLMRSFGGGGHYSAASAVMKKVNPGAVEDMIVELVKGNQQSSVQISDLMSYPVFTVSDKMKMWEAAKIFKEKGCTGVPVLDDQGKLVGIISRVDFKKIRKDSQLESPVKAFMSRDVKSIEPGRSPMQAAQMMIKYDIGRLPVVERDKIIGIVTRSDAMTFFYDLLPG